MCEPTAMVTYTAKIVLYTVKRKTVTVLLLAKLNSFAIFAILTMFS